MLRDSTLSLLFKKNLCLLYSPNVNILSVFETLPRILNVFKQTLLLNEGKVSRLLRQRFKHRTPSDFCDTLYLFPRSPLAGQTVPEITSSPF